MDNDKSMTPDKGVMQAMQLFDAVTVGDKRGYRKALTQGGKLVPDPYKQLLLIDCIIAARHRAYTEVVS